MLSFSICLPAISIILKGKRVSNVYQPFFFLIIISLLVEILSNVLYYYKIGNALIVNIFVLIEFYCWLKFFTNLRVNCSQGFARFIMTVGIAGVILWVLDNFFIGDIKAFNIWYKLFYSFVLVFLSLDQINILIVYEKKSLNKNATFIICIGILIFFCYKIFLEIIWKFGNSFSKELLVNVFTIQSFVNAFVNLLYAIAVLWIPTKKFFTKL